MFVDELTIHAEAGRGGDGALAWHREKHRPLGGPAGGNGGKGGDVYVRAVRNINELAKYTGTKEFRAENGDAGQGENRHGKNGADLIIDIPIGTMVTHVESAKTYELLAEGEVILALRGGNGGLGNETFKSSTNRSPQDTTNGKLGEKSTLHLALSLVVDVGIIGLPNAGKSTLLNALTNAHSRVGAYPFTTLVPDLGDLYGYTLADIPGLIEGAAEGKGLGHTFLRHVQKTKMLLHCVALTDDDVSASYETVRHELAAFDGSLTTRTEWIILTKSDAVDEDSTKKTLKLYKKKKTTVFVVSRAALSA
jgi:GTP-binding protein